MSWNFQFAAANKAVAKKELDDQAGHMPEALKAVIAASIDEQPGDVAIFVKSNGHIGGAFAHNATFEVYGVTLARSTAEYVPEGS